MRLRSHLFLGMLIGTSMASVAVAAPLELLTAKEAAEPNLPMPKPGLLPVGEAAGAKPTLPGGPQIIIDKPAQNAAVQVPFPVKIRFVPSSGSKIKLDSLEIDVLKLIRISLVSRLKPYLTAVGINVPEAQVPSGTYNIHIAVEDDHGHRSETTQTWTVR
jgi:hypothetical protein